MVSEKVFVDTSAFYALMDRSDNNYKKAASLWTFILKGEFYLSTSNYVVLETVALMQNRLGFKAVNLWYRDVVSLAEFLWIDGSIHNLAIELWRSMGRRKLSLVDCVSFVAMRYHKIEKVFAFDKHFEEQGFEILDKSFNSLSNESRPC